MLVVNYGFRFLGGYISNRSNGAHKKEKGSR